MSLDFDSARLTNPFLTPSHEEWRKQLRRFIDKEIMPYAEEWDEAGKIPDSLWPKAAEVGIFAVGYPEAYGGLSEGLDIWYGHIVQEELARIGAGGVTAALSVHGISLPSVLKFTGEKGARGVSVLLIPADLAGVTRTPLDKKQGWWASDTATIYFDNVRVPKANLLGEENQGFKVIMNNFNLERLGLVVNMEAYSRVCLAEAVEWAQQRKTFGKTLSEHQVIRHKIADMKQRINATQAYLQTCTYQLEQGKPNVGDIAMLKVQASQTMEFCAREAMQILGGIGYIRGSKVERLYREVRVNAIGGGSEEIMRDLACRQYEV